MLHCCVQFENNFDTCQKYLFKYNTYILIKKTCYYCL